MNFVINKKKNLGSNLPDLERVIQVVSHSGGYGIHIPANEMNNVSPCLLVRSIRLVVAHFVRAIEVDEA